MTPSLEVRAAAVAAATIAMLGCGGSDRAAPEPATMLLTQPEENSGDNQVGVAGVRLPDSLRAVVTLEGEPVEGATVIWFTTEGTLDPDTTVSGPDGAVATTWAPMPLFAEQFAAARIDGDGGDTTAFTAIATPDPEAPNTILVGDGGDTFEPASFTVQQGGTVNWFWPEGSAGHNIVADDGESPPPSGAPADWPKWHVFRFTTPGVYRYHCSVHGGPGGVGMSGTITVEEVAPE